MVNVRTKRRFSGIHRLSWARLEGGLGLGAVDIGAEGRLLGAAVRATPRRRDVREAGAGRDALLGQAVGFFVYVVAAPAHEAAVDIGRRAHGDGEIGIAIDARR